MRSYGHGRARAWRCPRPPPPSPWQPPVSLLMPSHGMCGTPKALPLCPGEMVGSRVPFLGKEALPTCVCGVHHRVRGHHHLVEDVHIALGTLGFEGRMTSRVYLSLSRIDSFLQTVFCARRPRAARIELAPLCELYLKTWSRYRYTQWYFAGHPRIASLSDLPYLEYGVIRRGR